MVIVDVNTSYVDAWNDSNLNNLPVFEPGLDKIVEQASDRNLFFSTDVDKASLLDFSK